jgi:4'-phosphopantetheinyl transferase
LRNEEKGRPYLPECPELWFSFSSCTLGMLGAWSVAHAVGVDMENQDQKVETVALANQFFTVRESDAIARLEGDVQQQTFYRLWTLKEAALKSIGEGLPFGLDRFGIDVKNTLRFACAPAEYGGPNSFCGHEIEGIPARAALVTRDRFCDSAWHSPKAGITCSGSMAANSDR